MRLKVMCLLIWAFLLAQVASRPQQTGPETLTTEVTKELDEDARSRYRASHIVSRNFNEFYNKLYTGDHTPGIIDSIRQSSSRDRKNLTIYSQNSFDKIENSKVDEQLESRKFRNHLRNSIKLDIVDKSTVLSRRPMKNSGRRATTKSPVVAKNRVVIKPSIYPSTFLASKNRPVALHSMKKGSKPNLTTPHVKNWPNNPPQDIQDLYNYEKYTTHPLPPDKKPLTTSKPIKQSAESNNKVTGYLPVFITPHREPLMRPNVQEIIQWLQIPAFSPAVNQSYLMRDTESGQSISNTFKPVFNPNRPLPRPENLPQGDDEDLNDFHLPEPNKPQPSPFPSTERPTVETVTLANSLSTLIDEVLTDPSEGPRRPVLRPISEVSQNTVVHIINPMSKNPNVTVDEGQNSQNVSTLKPPPNVHIMFMSQGNDTDESVKDSLSQLPFHENSDCPTITINSITKVNNTIQSKQGCTDLNIIINSQVLSTNNFDPGVLEGDASGSDKYAGLLTSTDESSAIYETPPSLTYYSPPPTDPDRNDLQDPPIHQDPSAAPENPSYDVNQETNVEYQSDPEESQFSEDGEQSEYSEIGETAEDEPSGAAEADRPLTPAVGSGEAFEQASNPVGGPGGLAAAGSPGSITPVAGSSAGSSPGGSTALATVDDDDDDDDYDFFDMTPTGVMEGMGSVFTYFTFLNPLNYGIFSFAAAPFAALAAGILGIAAFSFPYAFTGGLDFARSSDKGSVKFRPNIEEVVKQSIHNYRNLQEWKSKRRKRRR